MNDSPIVKVPIPSGHEGQPAALALKAQTRAQNGEPLDYSAVAGAIHGEEKEA